jgi:hypothetical protein
VNIISEKKCVKKGIPKCPEEQQNQGFGANSRRIRSNATDQVSEFLVDSTQLCAYFVAHDVPFGGQSQDAPFQRRQSFRQQVVDKRPVFVRQSAAKIPFESFEVNAVAP